MSCFLSLPIRLPASQYHGPFAAFAAVDLQVREPDVTLTPPTTPQRAANLTFLFTYDTPAARHYQLAEFPGGHTGWLLRPKGFAAKLREILG
jgi:hypothetical protein